MELSLYLSKDTDFGWKIYSTTKCSGKMVYQNKGVVFYTNSTTKDTTYRINATGFYWFHLGNCTDGIIPRQIFTINTPRYNELQTKFHSVTGRAGNSSMIVVSVPGRGRYCEFKIVDTPFSWNQMNTFSLIPLFCLLFIVSLTPCSYSIMSLSFVRCYWPCCSPSKAEVQGERHLEEQKLNKGRCQIKLPRRGPTSEFDGKERLFELMDAENEEAMGTLFDIEYDPDDTGLGLEEEIPLEQAHNDEQKDGPDGPLSEANLENRTELVPMMD
ncbi:hypothetical protein BLNAU_12683 [Blattamonas nauphoetae]|uniref:Uncharacterized protein n=1 Tax=Blattamonas nauphoetae TaxID=2049346 RepID=A0ABQ9XQB1_9EUKA|nr:hypothetical protein BLNAU_12683 [Blattamonas nauphoetae]